MVLCIDTIFGKWLRKSEKNTSVSAVVTFIAPKQCLLLQYTYFPPNFLPPLHIAVMNSPFPQSLRRPKVYEPCFFVVWEMLTSLPVFRVLLRIYVETVGRKVLKGIYLGKVIRVYTVRYIYKLQHFSESHAVKEGFPAQNTFEPVFKSLLESIRVSLINFSSPLSWRLAEH